MQMWRYLMGMPVVYASFILVGATGFWPRGPGPEPAWSVTVLQDRAVSAAALSDATAGDTSDMGARLSSASGASMGSRRRRRRIEPLRERLPTPFSPRYTS